MCNAQCIILLIGFKWNCFMTPYVKNSLKILYHIPLTINCLSSLKLSTGDFENKYIFINII